LGSVPRAVYLLGTHANDPQLLATSAEIVLG
jgi:hypothetical protein